MTVENWHSAVHLMHQREQEYQQEAEQYRLAKRAKYTLQSLTRLR